MLKITLWSIVTVCLLIVLACTLVVWILTPERLTPMVEDAANEYLDADVKIERVELTFWHTFPKLTVDVDSVRIISNSLSQLPDSLRTDLPQDADSLFSLSHLHAGINLAMISMGEVALYDVILESPQVNLLMVNEKYSNYDIVPPSETDTTETTIPTISINRFAINNANSLRFRSLSDSVDVALHVRTVEFNGSDAPDYMLDVDMQSNIPMLQRFNLHDFPVSVNGKIKWDQESPFAVELDNFKLKADSLDAGFSTAVEFEDTLRVNSFKGEINSLSVSYLLSKLPEVNRKAFKGLETNMVLDVKVELTAPYLPGDTTRMIPDMKCSLTVPDCHVNYHNLHWRKFTMEVNADVDGGDMNRTKINLKKLIINGAAMDIDLKAEITDMLDDPYVKGKFKGRLNLGGLPPVFVNKFSKKLTGVIDANLKIDSRKSYFTLNKFHRTHADGSLGLKNFEFISTDSATRTFITEGKLEFGTNRKFTTDAAVVDSLLTVSLKIDSGSVNHSTTMFRVKDLKGGVGTRLTRHTGDRNQISGFGGTLKFGNVRVSDSKDSLLVRITGVECNASLKRYQGDATAPELTLSFDAQRLMGAEPDMIMGLRKGHFDVTAHFRKRRNHFNRTDSTTVRQRRTHIARVKNEEDIDMEVDSGLKAVLRRWDVRGNIKAAAGGLFARALPVKNRFRNVDLSFSTDSIILHELDYTLGTSNFHINGYIGNLRRSLSNSRRDNKLRIGLDVTSDALNINEISHLAFTDFSATGNDLTASVESDDIDHIGNGEHHTDGVSKAFLVPGNIEAELKLNAKHLLYTDIEFSDFTGEVLIMNNAINLRNLTAKADIGSIDLTALYSTYDKNDIQFGMGLKINRFKLAEAMKLVPAIDTVMPMLQNFKGIINADIAATASIDSVMNIELPTLKAAMKLSGDSLVLLDADTFKYLSKWLFFKDKKHNMIDHMSVEMVVEDNQLEIFPFIFDIDRYRLGVMGTNDLSLNLNYHISVLKSPLPFKFGINISGNAENMKIRLGGAKFKNNKSIERVSIADTTRINLVHQIENIFRRSANSERLNLNNRRVKFDNDTVPITAEDSLLMIKEGFIDTPKDSLNVSK